MDQYILNMLSPIGVIEIKATDKAVTSVNFVSSAQSDSMITPDILIQCKNELQEYFAGTRKTFDVNIEPEGTGFQHAVWKHLQQIPFGTTTTYISIAKKLNNPDSVRAVGLANGKNRIAIIIPCHRVIGANGSLVGYAGGLHRKKWLLEHEGNISGNNRSLF